MKKYLIIGGTGSLGKEMVSLLSSKKNINITVLSRNELNQVQLKSCHPNLKVILGDARDYDALDNAMKNMDYVMHFAALKHVDILENNIEESIKTNISASLNCGKAAIKNGVSRVVFSSTDKAVMPINVYGMCKAISERYFNSLNESQDQTRFIIYRWGNVIASSGSAIPFFIKSLRETGSVNITDKKMTRFWINLSAACNFIWESFEEEERVKIRIPSMKAASVERVVKVLAQLLGLKTFNVNIIGVRPGEKIHESIIAENNYNLDSYSSPQYSDEELFELLEPVVKKCLQTS